MRVCVVGAGTRFLSGISYYTLRLVNALAQEHQVSMILMRQLLPTFLYPGRERVGKELTKMQYPAGTRLFDGVDWYWIPSILRAIGLLGREHPDTVVFQWWSGTVLHSYLLLALVAKLFGAKVVIEFHEVLDTGEWRILPARLYARLLAPLLLRLTSAFIVHSEFDRKALQEHYRLGKRPIEVMHLGPFDHHAVQDVQPVREAPSSCCNLLFFGVIRPFKGLEDLIAAFDSLTEEEAGRYWLTVVGETWEGWSLPSELIGKSRYRERITFVNRYVSDEEVAGFFAGADAVALPYHRSSASGPLHTTMSHGLPVIVTRVGGLIEAAAGYEGAIMVPPKDPTAIANAIRQLTAMTGKHYTDPHSWKRNVEHYRHLFRSMDGSSKALDEALT
ncbi:MAG: glycosyltransferase family 4 protein [Chloroflexi bacterium]|nr:glycosyltransferase family 4 protein [Chloroflexota bacterium]